MYFSAVECCVVADTYRYEKGGSLFDGHCHAHVYVDRRKTGVMVFRVEVGLEKNRILLDMLLDSREKRVQIIVE